MRYTIYRAVKQLVSHKFVYSLFIVQVTLGMALISFSLNYWLSAQRAQKRMEESVQIRDTMIEGLTLGKEGNFEYEDYRHIQEITKGQSTLHVAVKEEDTYFIYGEEADGNMLLRGNHVSGGRFPDGYEVQTLPERLKKRGIVVDSEWISFEDAVLLPLKDIENLNSDVLAVSDCYIIYLIQSERIKDSGNVLNEVVNYLEQKTPTENFTFVTPIQQIKDQLGYELIIPNYLGKLAAVAIFVMLCGFSGVMNLHMKKREKEIAVSIAMGATFHNIVAELFIEVFTVYTCGGLLGNFAAWIMLKENSLTTLFVPSYSPAICLATIILLLVLTVIVLARPIYRVKCISVSTLLNSM